MVSRQAILISHALRSRPFKGDAVIFCCEVVNKLVYSGSADHTGRSWVLEFGDTARVFRGPEHTVSCIKHQDGIGQSPPSYSQILIQIVWQLLFPSNLVDLHRLPIIGISRPSI